MKKFKKLFKKLELLKIDIFILRIQLIEENYSIGLKRLDSFLNIENLSNNSYIESIIKMKNIFDLKSKYRQNIQKLLKNSICPNLLKY